MCVNCVQTDVLVQKLRHQIAELNDKVRQKNANIAALQARLHTRTDRENNPKTEKCKICAEKLTPFEFNDHLCRNDVTHIVCEYCSMSFKTTVSLLDHLEIFHDDKSFYNCLRCIGKFEMKELLNIHMKRHPDDELPKYNCDICKQNFYLKTHLDKHKKAEHPEPDTNPILKRKFQMIFSKYFENSFEN